MHTNVPLVTRTYKCH